MSPLRPAAAPATRRRVLASAAAGGSAALLAACGSPSTQPTTLAKDTRANLVWFIWSSNTGVRGDAYPTYVSAVDADGDEVGGVRLPDLAVPLATYTGWNPRDPSTGGDGLIVNMQGSTIPFPSTAAERARTGDPRPSVAERYRDRADFLERVRTAAQELVVGRYLLPEDVEATVRLASERYDAFAAAPAVI